MVNRIDGNIYYEYRKSQSVNLNDRTDTGEKFSLDYKKDSLAFEEKEKKDKETSDTAKAAEQNGVRLELSNRGRTSAVEGKALKEANARGNAEQVSLADMLRDFVRSAVSAIRGLLYRIWYDPPAKEQDAATQEMNAQEIGTSEEDLKEIDAQKMQSDIAVDEPTAEELTNAVRNETARIDREVQQYLKSGNLSQVVSLLTNDGKKVAAHNSTLLTYYDRNGRMIELSASDKERILHGERSTIEL